MRQGETNGKLDGHICCGGLPLYSRLTVAAGYHAEGSVVSGKDLEAFCITV